MLGNNKTSLTLIKDPKSENQTKYIDVMYYNIRRLIDKGELLVE